MRVEVHDYVDEAIPLCCKQWKSASRPMQSWAVAWQEAMMEDLRAISSAADSRKLMTEDIKSARSSLFTSAGWLQKKA